MKVVKAEGHRKEEGVEGEIVQKEGKEGSEKVVIEVGEKNDRYNNLRFLDLRIKN
jgi:hypothetical protein